MEENSEKKTDVMIWCKNKATENGVFYFRITDS